MKSILSSWQNDTGDWRWMVKQNKVFERKAKSIENRKKAFLLSLVRPKQCTKAIFIFISISFLSIERLNDAWRKLKLKNWILRLKWHLPHCNVHWDGDGTFAISGFRKMQFIDSSDVKWTNEILAVERQRSGRRKNETSASLRSAPTGKARTELLANVASTLEWCWS